MAVVNQFGWNKVFDAIKLGRKTCWTPWKTGMSGVRTVCACTDSIYDDKPRCLSCVHHGDGLGTNAAPEFVH